MEQSLPTETVPCATCNTPLQGGFCHQCGEKQLRPGHDLSLWHFIKEAFEHFTHLDSKLLRSFWALFAKPGFLTAEFIAGRRVRYLKPLPLFVIAGVLFYLFFATATAFFSNLGDMSRGYKTGNRLSNTFQVDTETILAQKAAAATRDPESFWLDMKTAAAEASKTWMFLMVPAWGFLLWLFFYRRIKWFVPHLIFALHGLTFFVALDMLLLLLFHNLLQFNQLGDRFVLLLAVCFAFYCMLAVRQVYGLGKFRSILAGTGVTVLFLLVLLLYRQSITLYTLYTY